MCPPFSCRGKRTEEVYPEATQEVFFFQVGCCTAVAGDAFSVSVLGGGQREPINPPHL